MLTAAKIKNTRSKDRAFKLYDSKGLFLLVNPNGKMYWRYRYQYNKKAKTLSLGPYPLVSLKSARDERDEMFLVLKKGIDPSAERKLAKSLSEAEEYEDQHTFRFIALQYLLKQAGRPPTQKHKSVDKLQKDFDQCMESMAEDASTKPRSGTLRTIHRRLERFIFPYVGNQNIRSMTGPQVLALIRKIEERDIAETARRTLAACRRVCRFAVSEGKADFDAAGSIDARESLVPVKRRHFPTLTEPRKIGELMRAIHGYEGQPTTEAALKLMPLVFVRPGELRAAEWVEFDFAAAEWRIPDSRMKMGREHIVPLSRQAVEVLEELRPITANGQFVLRGNRGRNRYMSENTMNSALRRLGYTKDDMCPHGFRAMASTRLNEMNFPGDVIELQLAHKPSDKIRAAYNRAERLSERRSMMQQWADYLYELRDGSKKVVTIKRIPSR